MTDSAALLIRYPQQRRLGRRFLRILIGEGDAASLVVVRSRNQSF
jgi:hypothetical protein